MIVSGSLYLVNCNFLEGFIQPRSILTRADFVLDNSTRWTSTRLSLQRAVKRHQRIELFCFECKTDLKHDTLTDAEWPHLGDIIKRVQPFHDITLVLEGLAQHAHFGGYLGRHYLLLVFFLRRWSKPCTMSQQQEVREIL